ncbi:hypothetical protein AGOR_G00050410 [Albula goreensis]|uniref:Uncharacterized protein n=1 Tax=Albula goreensis TaxID=1534307 RepID=A0A8T3DXC9_9TELE|nr:hypothetical protein AGOR_G00050410 [Albula goreensis]
MNFSSTMLGKGLWKHVIHKFKDGLSGPCTVEYHTKRGSPMPVKAELKYGTAYSWSFSGLTAESVFTHPKQHSQDFLEMARCRFDQIL